MTYSVVLLNGKELESLSEEQIRDLFLNRQINQNSLVRSDFSQSWQMLKREFDLNQWIPNVGQFPAVNQHAAAPSQAPATIQGNFANTQPTEHTQNNQTQTFYQAETLPEENKLRDIRSNYAPNAVRFEPVARAQTTTAPEPSHRPGHRPAAVFLLVNAMLFVAILFVGGMGEIGNSSAEMSGLIGRVVIPIIIDLYLAFRLWKENESGVRKWVLIRAYVGFAIGLAAPFAAGDAFTAVIGFVFGVLGLFYLIAIGLVLHGKTNPSPGRIYAGVGSFAVFAVVTTLAVGLGALGKALPTLAKMDFSNPEIQKYRIDGSEFRDATTGASITIPEGWTMLSTSNPFISTPYARMIALDKSGDRMAMLEVVPVPAELDMKRQTPSTILDKLCDGVIDGMGNDPERRNPFGKTVVREMSRIATYVGKHPAKLMIVERSEMGQRLKGHVVITYDELTFYVLHSWCPTDKYSDSQTDFESFEKGFTVPESINSTFTQAAENERRR